MFGCDSEYLHIPASLEKYCISYERNDDRVERKKTYLVKLFFLLLTQIPQVWLADGLQDHFLYIAQKDEGNWSTMHLPSLRISRKSP